MLQRTSLEVQRLRLHASTEGGTDFIPGGGTKNQKKKKRKKKNVPSFLQEKGVRVF